MLRVHSLLSNDTLDVNLSMTKNGTNLKHVKIDHKFGLNIMISILLAILPISFFCYVKSMLNNKELQSILEIFFTILVIFIYGLILYLQLSLISGNKYLWITIYALFVILGPISFVHVLLHKQHKHANKVWCAGNIFFICSIPISCSIILYFTIQRSGIKSYRTRCVMCYLYIIIMMFISCLGGSILLILCLYIPMFLIFSLFLYYIYKFESI